MMACCVAIAVVIGILRTAWYRVVRRSSPPRTGLPPQARRPAPAAGYPAEGRVRAVAVAPGVVQTPTRPAPVGAVALGAAAGVLLNVGMVGLTRVTGLAMIAPGAALGPIRDQVLVVIAAVLGAIVAWCAVRDVTAMVSQWPLAVGVAGGSWFLLSVIDMHVVGLVPAGAHAGHEHGAHGVGGHPGGHGLPHLLFDVLFHGPGLAVLVAGAALSWASRRPASLRP